jgi:hypothetical protein
VDCGVTFRLLTECDLPIPDEPDELGDVLGSQIIGRVIAIRDVTLRPAKPQQRIDRSRVGVHPILLGRMFDPPIS